MSKDKISDYSSTANSNTDIAGINIDEGCAPSGINDAIRTLMAQLKTWQSGGQDVYIHPAGSASAPSITANGDTNTGLFFPAADTIGITTGGTERARVDSSGNLGVGTASPGVRLEVSGASAGSGFSALRVGNTDTTAGSTVAMLFLSADDGTARNRSTLTSGADGSNSGYLAFSTRNAGSLTEKMRLDASGNLGVGTTSPTSSSVLDVAGSGATHPRVRSTGANSAGFYTQNSSTGTTTSDGLWVGIGGTGVSYVFNYENTDLIFGTNATERARIDSSGQLLIGTTDVTTVAAGAFTFRSVGTTNTYLSVGHKTGSITGADFVAFYYNTSQIGGCAQNGTTAVSFNTTSDYRLKTNVVPLTGALAKVEALKPSSFEWIDGRQDEGFIAHELQAVLPNVVSGAKDAVQEDGSPKYQQVDYSKIVTVLTAAIQELKAEFDAYKASHP